MDFSCASNVPINPLLKCGEEWMRQEQCDEDDDDYDFRGPITFHIQLHGSAQRLNFNSRDKSSGVLLPSEPSVKKEDTFDGPSDPFFFEKGFYLEAKTGFQVWHGSRLMVEAFTCGQSVDGMKYWKEKLSLGQKLNILEVGAGIGVVGTCLAAAGGNVLITDLPVLVEHGIWPNLRRNGIALRADEDVVGQCPKFLNDASENSLFDAVQLGKGWARPAVLDWFKPVEEQLPGTVSSNIDVIVACDCIFLRKLADPLLTTIATIFEHSSGNNPKFLFTFQRRNMLGLFIQLEELLDRIKERGWSVECVAWRNVDMEDDGMQENYLFQVSPGKRSELLNDSSAVIVTSSSATLIEEKKE